MQSKTSLFNGTVFKKNLARFAPAWGLYTLCLILGMIVLYTDDGAADFWFASRMCGNTQLMSLVNLFYAPLVAMLLFGDLYASRMCNALHAMPLKREGWFLTNVLSGLVFSILPTAVMALLSIPLLMGTCVANAWQIALLWFLGANLEFICFFGIAVFSAFCTGNRLAMALVYAALNGGAYVIYMILENIYTPMLFGVGTPFHWAEVLTPIAKMSNDPLAEVENFNDLRALFQGRESEMTARFWLVPGSCRNLIVWAIVGIAFGAAALLLYRRRKLECAGDALALRGLEPVFMVCISTAGAVLAYTFLVMFLKYRSGPLSYLWMAAGMVVGWFAGRMLVERSVRVFRFRNWRGLLILAAAAAISIAATRFDVLGIEDWVPDAEEVSSVTISSGGGEITLTEEEDIQQITRLHQLALETRIADWGSYPLSYVQSLPEDTGIIHLPDSDFYSSEYEEGFLTATNVTIGYQMKSGRQPTRYYNIWTEGETGSIMREFMSRWETVWESGRNSFHDSFDINRISEISCTGKSLPAEETTAEAGTSLLAAIQADCEERTMAQNSDYHSGYFRRLVEEEETYQIYSSLSVQIWTYIGTGTNYEQTAVFFEVYPDSRNTLKWLEDHDLLIWEICEGEPD